MPSLPRRTLIVTGQEEEYSGEGARGAYTIYSVTATSVEGELIELALNTFEVLPQGEPIEVTVKKKADENYGDKYTLKLVHKKSKADDLAERVYTTERALADLAGRIEVVERALESRP